jgi:hypothetical protein
MMDLFAWKLFKRLGMAGLKDVYKPFRIMGSAFMYYMYIQTEAYNFNACRCWGGGAVENDGHVGTFLSHDKIFVPVHKSNNHWVIFIICPADRQIAVFDSLYEPRQWYVTILDNLVRFIHDYQKSKDILNGLGICIRLLSRSNRIMTIVEFVLV